MSVDPNKMRPWVRRVMIVALLVFCVLLYVNFGWLRVPHGMDTMPDEFPGGTLCLIQKQPGSVAVGSVVFVDVDGGTVLTRVVGVVGQRVEVEHDNKSSKLGFGGCRGLVSVSAIRAIVLTGLTSDS